MSKQDWKEFKNCIFWSLIFFFILALLFLQPFGLVYRLAYWYHFGTWF